MMQLHGLYLGQILTDRHTGKHVIIIGFDGDSAFLLLHLGTRANVALNRIDKLFERTDLMSTDDAEALLATRLRRLEEVFVSGSASDEAAYSDFTGAFYFHSLFQSQRKYWGQ